jgi:N-methylhydantoinase A/oxoprolinase/acetone carboxylase beta subunit
MGIPISSRVPDPAAAADPSARRALERALEYMDLTPGQAILGPAIVEEPFTTIVLYPGQRATVDARGNYTIAVGKA